MLARRSGRILNLNTVADITVGEGAGVYSATKFFVSTITESLRKEVGNANDIQVSMVSPGVIDTGCADILGRQLTQRPYRWGGTRSGEVRAYHLDDVEGAPGHPGNEPKEASMLRRVGQTDSVDRMDAGVRRLCPGCLPIDGPLVLSRVLGEPNLARIGVERLDGPYAEDVRKRDHPFRTTLHP